MLRFNQPVQSAAIGMHATQDGWHDAELSGIWSCDPFATLSFPLDERVVEAGGRLVVECIGACDDDPSQWIELGVEGLGAQRVCIVDSSIHLLSIAIPPGYGATLTLRLRASRLVHVAGQKGDRARGGMIKSVRVVPARHLHSLRSKFGTVSDHGVAHMRLPEGKPRALRLETSRPGRILGFGDDDAIWTAVSQDGVFDFSTSTIERTESLTFVARDLGASCSCIIVPVDNASFETATQHISAAGLGTFDEIRTSGEHFGAAMLNFSSPSTAESIRVLIGWDGDECSWRARPAYGVSWTHLAGGAAEESDVRGAYRHRRIVEGEIWRHQDGNPDAELMANLLRACIDHLSRDPEQVARKFVDRLLRKILVPPGGVT